MIITSSFQQAIAFSVDPDNNFYVLDSKTNELLKISCDGKILQSTGGYGWSELSFDQPMDVTSPDGINVYVADYGNHRIIRFDRQLNFISTLSFRDNENVSQRFGYPKSVAMSRLGDLFLIDGDNIRIVKVKDKNKYDRAFGGIDAGKGRLHTPSRLRISSDDLVYCQDKNTIKVYDIFGNYVRTIGDSLFHNLVSFTVDQNKIYAIDSCNILILDSKSVIESVIRITNHNDVNDERKLRDIEVQRNAMFILTPNRIYRRNLTSNEPFPK